MVGPDRRHATARHVVEADGRDIAHQELGDIYVLLELRGGCHYAVHPPFYERTNHFDAVVAVIGQVADQH